MSVCAVNDMTGYAAQLHRTTTDGVVIESNLVFRPECEWFMPKAGDRLGEIEYTDVVEFVEDFGVDALNKVLAGNVVFVKKKPGPDVEYRGCPQKGKPYRRVTRNVIFPVKAVQDDLTRI